MKKPVNGVWNGGRGFAGISQEDRSRISRLGGLAAQKKGTAHRWTSVEASFAGQRGGRVTAKNKREREKKVLA